MQPELQEKYLAALDAEANKQWVEAFDLLTAAAAGGHPDALLRLGDIYRHGNRAARRNSEEAIKCYKQAARAGFAPAAFRLYSVYDEDKEPSSRNLAFFWLRVAALFGDPAAQFCLGETYMTTGTVKSSPKHVLYWLTEATKNGSEQAAVRLARLYSDGQVVVKNLHFASHFFGKVQSPRLTDKILLRHLAEVPPKAPPAIDLSSLPSEYYELGQSALSQKENTLATRIFRIAAEIGFAPAQNKYAVCCEKGIGMPSDEGAAVVWYTRAANGGFPPALLNLANCYKLGIGTEKDPRRAIALYEKAATLGDAAAQYILANAYIEGELVSSDLAAAIDWYKKAALQGHVKAANRLHEISAKLTDTFNRAVECYEAKNFESAVRLYTIAAELGHAGAACNLGYCYQEGIGCKKDPRLAVKYYRMGAELGSSAAKLNLGVCYLKGAGVPYSYKEARACLVFAKEHGHASAEGLLKEMEARKQKKLAQRIYSHSTAVFHRGEVEEAIRMRVEAARMDSARAQFILGCHFEFGVGLPEDREKASRWYASAAQNGFSGLHSHFKSGFLRERKLLQLKAANKL